jgi:hypothetical protein
VDLPLLLVIPGDITVTPASNFVISQGEAIVAALTGSGHGQFRVIGGNVGFFFRNDGSIY